MNDEVKKIRDEMAEKYWDDHWHEMEPEIISSDLKEAYEAGFDAAYELQSTRLAESEKKIEKLRGIVSIAYESLQMHRDKGHNDNCSNVLTEHPCDCGVERARYAVRLTQEFNKREREEM